MDTQLNLFDVDALNINAKLSTLCTAIRFGGFEFSIDNLQKASTMYGVLCETVWDTYERVINDEQLSNNSSS